MTGPAEAQRRPRVVLTLGKFDGVHAGHRHLAAWVQVLAEELGAKGAALVLHPHPASVLAGRRIQLLSTVRQRCARLRGLGLHIAEPLQFTPEIARLQPEAFLDRLAQRFRLEAVVVGPDFAFGHSRAAGVEALAELGRERGFRVEVVPPLQVGGRRVSSRGIRELLAQGEVASVRQLLREPPRLTGTVVHGAARGRELGFPTANLDLREDFVVPGNGIYAVRARWKDAPSRDGSGWVDGVASIGVRPTFDDGPRSIEVFLLDFSGDLYGQQLELAFVARQRGEERFASVQDLIEQMHADVDLAREILAAERAPTWQVVEGPEGSRAHLRGFDLAALCEAAADCLPALRRRGSAVAPQHPWPGSRAGWGRPLERCRLLELRLPPEATQAELLSAWLEVLDGASTARVFQAGEGRAGGLAAGFPEPAGMEPARALRLVGPDRGRDGWLHATLGLAGDRPGSSPRSSSAATRA